MYAISFANLNKTEQQTQCISYEHNRRKKHTTVYKSDKIELNKVKTGTFIKNLQKNEKFILSGHFYYGSMPI